MLKKAAAAIYVTGFLFTSILLAMLMLRFIPICIGAYLNQLALVRAQAYVGADLNSPWIFDETPLMITSNNSKKQIFEFLIESGADINRRTNSFYGETVLHRASRDGCYTCVDLLIAKNVDLDQTDSVGRTSVLFAVSTDQVEIVDRLLGAGGQPDAPDLYSGTTPLMEATRHKNIPIIMLLLAHGASAEKWSLKGETAISIAEKNGDDTIVALLKGSSAVKQQN